MEELTNLAEACDVEVIGQVTQNLQRVNPSHYIGKGKIEEVAAYVQEIDANMVILMMNYLSSQIRNLEEDLDCKVIDRTILILDILRNVRKRKKHSQVEVAHLQYMMPRLIGLRESLGRQSGRRYEK